MAIPLVACVATLWLAVSPMPSRDRADWVGQLRKAGWNADDESCLGCVWNDDQIEALEELDGVEMVFPEAMSEAGLMDGLQAWRTYVRVRGANRPSIEFKARFGGQSFGLGEVIPIAPFTTVVLEAVVRGAPGQMLHWIRQGQTLQSVAVSQAVPMRFEARARPGDWFSVIVSDEEGPTLVTGAIYTGSQ